jgi:tetratricopeptide (TPR) repeat protein
VRKSDWYRKTTWTSDDADDFFAQLASARTDTHRAQYIKIQAQTLAHAGKHREALELLDVAIERFPNRETTEVRKLRADSLWALGLREKALDAYRSAIAAQRAQRNIHCNVALAFAEAFHDVDDGKYRAELLDLLREEVGEPDTFGFPILEFRYALIFTRLLAGLDDMDGAAKWAERALSAQHPKGVDERTEIWLRNLVAWAEQ